MTWRTQLNISTLCIFFTSASDVVHFLYFG